MKRLNCTFEQKDDSNFPWLLKHPKVKKGLAKFKTREMALKWFITLNFEAAVWFQDPMKIFAGQLTIDNEDNEWYYYIKTKIFDGDATYESACTELDIDMHTFKLNRKKVDKEVNALKEGDDYILISDPQTYFPPDLEISKKKREDSIDIEAIKASVEDKFNNQKDKYEEQIHTMMQEVVKTETEYKILKSELELASAEKEKLENKLNKLSEIKEPVKFAYFGDLVANEAVSALDLYIKKVDKFANSISEQQISQNDYDRIVKNFSDIKNLISTRMQYFDYQNRKIAEVLSQNLENSTSKLLSKLSPDGRRTDNSSNKAYFVCPVTGNNLALDSKTSFVLLDLKHIAFVPKNEYHYSITTSAVKSTHTVALIETKEMIPTETLPSNVEFKNIHHDVETSESSSSRLSFEEDQDNNNILKEIPQDELIEPVKKDKTPLYYFAVGFISTLIVAFICVLILGILDMTGVTLIFNS